MSEVCVDANMAVKWYAPEEDCKDEAVAFLSECTRLGIRVIAPDGLLLEAASAFRRKVHRRVMAPDEGRMALSLLTRTQIDYVSTVELLDDAWRIAERYNLATLYDACYMALAEGRECQFWTADKRFLNSVAGVSFVRNVADFTPGMLENQ